MRKKKWIIWVVCFCVLMLIASAVYAAVTSIQNELQALSTVLIKNVDMFRVPNGVYAGQFATLPVSAKVEVSVEGGIISDIKLIEHKNGQGKPAEVIIEQVLEDQTLEVDLIAGATYSSKAILKAIEDALEKAAISD